MTWQIIYCMGAIALPAGVFAAEHNSELPPIGGWPMAGILLVCGLLWPFWLAVILGMKAGNWIGNRLW